MKVHIVSVNGKPAAKKDGTPITSKSGKPLFQVGIKTQEFGETWLNGLMPFNPDRWAGTEQELEVYDEEWQGRTFKKFKLPPRDAQQKTVVQENFTLRRMEEKLDRILHHFKLTTPDEIRNMPAMEPNFDVDTPF